MENLKLTSKQKDEIIEAMTRRIIFATKHYKWKGGFVRDSVTGKSSSPLHWFNEYAQQALAEDNQ